MNAEDVTDIESATQYRCEEIAHHVLLRDGDISRGGHWPGALFVGHQRLSLITDASLVPHSLIEVAGEYFKRFDRESCTFVPNEE